MESIIASRDGRRRGGGTYNVESVIVASSGKSMQSYILTYFVLLCG